MTEHEYVARRAALDQDKAAGKEHVAATHDQGRVKLMLEAKESGRGQEWVAKLEGKSQAWVSRGLSFGRFLNFMPPRHKNLAQLTEFRFREYWARTKGTETERFAAVADVLENGIPQFKEAQLNKPGLKEAVTRILSDGNWHSTAKIVKRLVMAA